jgi:hypothetical protein
MDILSPALIYTVQTDSNALSRLECRKLKPTLVHVVEVLAEHRGLHYVSLLNIYLIAGERPTRPQIK